MMISYGHRAKDQFCKKKNVLIYCSITAPFLWVKEIVHKFQKFLLYKQNPYKKMTVLASPL